MRSISPLASHAAPFALALVIVGAPTARAQATGEKPQTPAQPLTVELPPVELRKLDNGIDVAIMRDTARVVSVGVVLDVGPAVDPPDKAGLGNIVKTMLGLGTTTRSAREIADAAAALEGRVTPTFLYGPSANFDALLALLADQLLHPAFKAKAFEQLKAQAVANLKLAGDDPQLVAAGVFKAIFYGAEHPYARGQTAASVAAITRDDVVAFYAKYIRPPNVRFAVVGNISPDSAVARLNARFGSWQPGTPARVEVPLPTAPAQTKVYLVDRPGAHQSVIWIGGLGPRRDAPEYAAVSLLNAVLGGSSKSRINVSLRRDHRYTPDARSGFAFYPVPEPGAFAIVASVATEKTDSAALELMREVRDIGGARPITDEEFRAAAEQMRPQLARELWTAPQRAVAVADMLNNRLPPDYYAALTAKLAATTREEVQAAARTYITPDRLAIIVVGDRAALEARLRAANVAPVVVVDRKGAPVAGP